LTKHPLWFSPNDATDIAHETLLHLNNDLFHAPQMAVMLQDPKQAVPYTRVVAKHVGLSMIRARDRRVDREQRALAVLGPRSTMEALEHLDTLDSLFVEAKKLNINGDDLLILHLRFFGGFTVREIADVVESDYEQVKSRLRSMIQRLRQGSLEL
jgi:DNA-directed RNA polymerase specialized sigma24 family protein